MVLREFGSNKFLTKLDRIQWSEINNKFKDMSVFFADEIQNILGYDCKKVILKLTDGSQLAVYYAPSIIPSVKEFEYQFKDIPGFVLEYEMQENNGKKIRYTATKINFNPVKASLFDTPTDGYKILQK